MGGKHCCVVGCHNSNAKTKLLESERKRISYFSFPKDKEWRAKLILAVNRADASFNPDTAHICSVHFEDKHLLFHVTVSFTAFLKLQSRPFASTPENFDQLRNNSYGAPQWIQAHHRKLTNFKPAKKEHRDTLCSSKTRPNLSPNPHCP
uniref:THAP-type domain-containing protein n=1 Tax=Magallana gigas TaxID=29159 RepID=A0A8W8P249_MAGGI